MVPLDIMKFMIICGCVSFDEEENCDSKDALDGVVQDLSKEKSSNVKANLESPLKVKAYDQDGNELDAKIINFPANDSMETSEVSKVFTKKKLKN